MRIMSIDYGDVRVGIAISDPLGIIASPFKVLKNDINLINNIKNIIKEKKISKIIVGWPLSLDGKETNQTRKVANFIKDLESKVDIPIEKVDEAYTTEKAEDILLEGNISRKKRKKLRDKIAASFILQKYLNI